VSFADKVAAISKDVWQLSLLTGRCNVACAIDEIDPKAPIEWKALDRFTISGLKVVRKGKVKAFKGTVGTQSPVKRAVITLEEGHTIDVTTGL
jgi:hypothetical protein